MQLSFFFFSSSSFSSDSLRLNIWRRKQIQIISIIFLNETVVMRLFLFLIIQCVKFCYWWLFDWERNSFELEETIYNLVRGMHWKITLFKNLLKSALKVSAATLFVESFFLQFFSTFIQLSYIITCFEFY